MLRYDAIYDDFGVERTISIIERDYIRCLKQAFLQIHELGLTRLRLLRMEYRGRV